MSTLVAVLDADVLVPILSCDLLPSAFDEDLYRPVVTATILHETERTLVHSFTHLDPVTLRGRVAQVAVALSHHTHDEGDVNAAAVAAVNRKDRHVAATARAHGADVVVSNDRRLRREINTLGEPLLAMSFRSGSWSIIPTASTPSSTRSWPNAPGVRSPAPSSSISSPAAFPASLPNCASEPSDPTAGRTGAPLVRVRNSVRPHRRIGARCSRPRSSSLSSSWQLPR
jgi:rRNA-processing protein FCF1